MAADEFGEESRTGPAAAGDGFAGWFQAAEVMPHPKFLLAGLFVSHFAFGAHHALGVRKTNAFAADSFDGQLALDHFSVAAFRGADKKGVPSSWLCA